MDQRKENLVTKLELEESLKNLRQITKENKAKLAM